MPIGLHDLLTGLVEDRLTEKSCAESLPDIPIAGVTMDSREARPGFVFVATRGISSDGHRYIQSAIDRGAAALVVEKPESLVAGIPGIVVRDGRKALARLAAAFNGYPSRKLTIIGITGTDGKTTTSSLVLSILQAARMPSGGITTVAATIAQNELDTGFHTTTPDSSAVQSYLKRMVESGAKYAVVETTSHGLDQHRVYAVDYDIAAITNVTREHLDYHKTFESYREAKGLLFTMVARAARKPGVPKVAILNADDPSSIYFQSLLRESPVDRILTYSLTPGAADIFAERIELTPIGAAFVAQTPGGKIETTISLPGRYNVANALCAIGVGLSLGIDTETIAAGLRSFTGVSGRFERVTLPDDLPEAHSGQAPYSVIVDFAHTSNSLHEALGVGRSLLEKQANDGTGVSRGRLISVFGSAGLRDSQKRPVMGRVAAEVADLVIITAEDPRTESVEAICAEIARGCEEAGKREGEGYIIVTDRAQAIERAIELARPGDLIMITGKGHERSMCFGTTEYPWSDQDAVRQALRRHTSKT